MKIWFDMDGTIADLYGVDGWLEMLIAQNATPYVIAKPLVNLNTLAKLMHKAQRNGFEICIVSALAKNSTADYDEKVKAAKMRWLKKHLASVDFDEIRFVPYTFTKNDVNSGNDILFDDEDRHLAAWTGKAFPANTILDILRVII